MYHNIARHELRYSHIAASLRSFPDNVLHSDHYTIAQNKVETIIVPARSNYVLQVKADELINAESVTIKKLELNIDVLITNSLRPVKNNMIIINNIIDISEQPFIIEEHVFIYIRMIDYGSHIFMHIHGYIFIINNFYARNSVNQSSEDHATDMLTACILSGAECNYYKLTTSYLPYNNIRIKQKPEKHIIYAKEGILPHSAETTCTISINNSYTSLLGFVQIRVEILALIKSVLIYNYLSFLLLTQAQPEMYYVV
ncbi:Retrovirus-related Pol polyprotein [Aphis craccivora]|uniref:Retrovirus-related Pol polyprotein n=1 Tax=Aphis craccivora TaxID=307492 RepID=A0A6G0ZF92_APHCR|nr:Retrovirus-related Pol polyprotein [Aphis craccivora]